MARLLRAGWVMAPLLLGVWASGLAGAAPPRGPLEARGQAPNSEAGASEEITLTLPGDVPLVLVRIPAGTFTMGSPEEEIGRFENEGPQHQVTITTDFYLGKTEVTQAQWQAVTGSSRSTDCDSFGDGENYPIYCLSYNDVCGSHGECGEQTGFLRELNDHLAATGQSYGGAVRLPTEAEWEYAARAGTTTRFSFGDGSECDEPCGSCTTYEEYMWWCGNAYYNTAIQGPRPTGQKQANPWGLFDMHGNVWELVSDIYGPYGSESETDPTGPLLPWRPVARGGGWGFWAGSCRSARRSSFLPNSDYRCQYLGFRVAMSQQSP